MSLISSFCRPPKFLLILLEVTGIHKFVVSRTELPEQGDKMSFGLEFDERFGDQALKFCWSCECCLESTSPAVSSAPMCHAFELNEYFNRWMH